jgi:hypothetical protein
MLCTEHRQTVRTGVNTERSKRRVCVRVRAATAHRIEYGWVLCVVCVGLWVCVCVCVCVCAGQLCVCWSIMCIPVNCVCRDSDLHTSLACAWAVGASMLYLHTHTRARTVHAHTHTRCTHTKHEPLGAHSSSNYGLCSAVQWGAVQWGAVQWGGYAHSSSILSVSSPCSL